MKWVVLSLFVLILIAEGLETHHRNQVWRSDKSLWEDAILKSPGDGRAWMNAGLTYMGRGEYSRALAYFYMCDSVWPGYAVNKINLAIAHGAIGDQDAASRYFAEAIRLNPALPDAHHFYARWLMGRGYCSIASQENDRAITLSNSNPAASYLDLRAKLGACR